MTTNRLLEMFREPSPRATERQQKLFERFWDECIDWDSIRAENVTCLDCENCTRCDIEGYENLGFCLEDKEFRDDSFNVRELGFDCFR